MIFTFIQKIFTKNYFYLYSVYELISHYCRTEKYRFFKVQIYGKNFKKFFVRDYTKKLPSRSWERL